MASLKGFVAYALLTAVHGQVAKKFTEEFSQFLKDFGKVYADETEHEVRYENFVKSLKYIEAENAKGHTFRLGINQFSDMTAAEFAASHNCSTGLEPWKGHNYLGTFKSSRRSQPTSLDWVEKGKVIPVKDQGDCGACWAFSATGATESAWAISQGALHSLSEQQLIDCTTTFGTTGCSGGNPKMAFTYESKGMCSEASYPYTASDGGQCREASCSKVVPYNGIRGYRAVDEDEQAILEALTMQPLSVVIDADLTFQMYSGGILQGCDSSNLDHSVLLVGYGSEGGLDYWKIKNSWGRSWGEDGYARILRGAGGQGECGINRRGSFPVVATGPPPPPPPPSPPSRIPYGKPSSPGNTCLPGEVAAQLDPGTELCVDPPNYDGSCPEGPPGIAAQPEAVLENQQTGDQYCCLVCDEDSDCPAGAYCLPQDDFSVCVWSTQAGSNAHVPLKVSKSKQASIAV